MLHLRVETPAEWTEAVCADVDAFLQDHAANEKKASAFALTMVSHYPDRADLVRTFLGIAREELEHFERVTLLLQARGKTLSADKKDAYVTQLMKHQRKQDRDEYLLDRLLTGAIVEARGTERFGYLATCDALEPPLRALYADLQKSEARHHAAFLNVARQYFDDNTVRARLDELLDAEADIVKNLPLRARLH